MKNQNEIFHRLGVGRFGELLRAVIIDPAMLVWLDAPSNRKGRPNENLGREIMELFTLGIGNYSENDVREAARALTGWSIDDRGDFINEPRYHDAGQKQIFGKQGNWDGHDLLETLIEQATTADRIAWRLCDCFMGEGVVSHSDMSTLANELRQEDLHIGKSVERMIRSENFFADNNIRSKVVDPVEFVMVPLRALELNDPPASTLKLARWLSDMGQNLFYPPNVAGWKGGRNWLSTRYIVMRANFATRLAEGGFQKQSRKGGSGESWLKIPEGIEPLQYFDQALFGGRISGETHQRIHAAMNEMNQVEDEVRTHDQKACRVLALLLALPEAQQG